MRLRVLLPTRTVVDEPARRIVAESIHGSFGMLPRHVDFAAPLAAGILVYENADGDEDFVAVDGGMLVKCGDEVLVSTPRAMRADQLSDLRRIVERSFRHRDEHERRAREALARMEAEFVARISALERHERT